MWHRLVQRISSPSCCLSRWAISLASLLGSSCQSCSDLVVVDKLSRKDAARSWEVSNAWCPCPGLFVVFGHRDTTVFCISSLNFEFGFSLFCNTSYLNCLLMPSISERGAALRAAGCPKLKKTPGSTASPQPRTTGGTASVGKAVLTSEKFVKKVATTWPSPVSPGTKTQFFELSRGKRDDAQH